MPRPAAVPKRFRPIADTALVCRRPERTIRTWAASGRIERMNDPRSGAVLVDLVAAYKLSEQTGRRNRTKAAA